NPFGAAAAERLTDQHGERGVVASAIPREVREHVDVVVVAEAIGLGDLGELDPGPAALVVRLALVRGLVLEVAGIVEDEALPVVWDRVEVDALGELGHRLDRRLRGEGGRAAGAELLDLDDHGPNA